MDQYESLRFSLRRFVQPLSWQDMLRRREDGMSDIRLLELATSGSRLDLTNLESAYFGRNTHDLKHPFPRIYKSNDTGGEAIKLYPEEHSAVINVEFLDLLNEDEKKALCVLCTYGVASEKFNNYILGSIFGALMGMLSLPLFTPDSMQEYKQWGIVGLVAIVVCVLLYVATTPMTELDADKKAILAGCSPEVIKSLAEKEADFNNTVRAKKSFTKRCRAIDSLTDRTR